MKKINFTLAGKKVVEKWKYWISVPLAIFLIALIAFGIYAGVNKDAALGVNIGIDFAGGNIITIQTKYDANASDANAKYNETLNVVKDVLAEKNAKISYDQMAGDTTLDVVVRFNSLSKDAEVNNQITDEIIQTLNAKLSSDIVNNITIERNGPSVQKELILTAFLSVLISTLLILVYIVIRFRNVFTGLSAVIALIHDVLIVFALTIIFHIQINSSFIAAIITIIAYSINNTIVLFDRVRENYKSLPVGESVNNNMVVNKSIAQTLSRSILTTITTMAAIVILAIIGVSSIREFALPVLFGLLAGTFSSIFIAPSLYCLMKNASDASSVKNKNKIAKPKKVQEKKEVKDTAVV